MTHGEIMAKFSAELRCQKRGCTETDMRGRNGFVFHGGLFLCELHALAASKLFDDDDVVRAEAWCCISMESSRQRLINPVLTPAVKAEIAVKCS